MPDSKARELRRAYYACISYTDAQIGKVLAELETEGFAEDTVIVLWADHGWQLGEHNHWCKFTNFEDATHVPFMIRVPGVTDQGMRTKALVELIDIFLSMHVTELAGLEVPPQCPEDKKKLLTCVEGSSVASLLENPDRQWKKAAFSQYPLPNVGLPVFPIEPPFPQIAMVRLFSMGYTIRVDSYRFTDWYRFDCTTGVPH
jgi:arylsulfatase A-like enzyme